MVPLTKKVADRRGDSRVGEVGFTGTSSTADRRDPGRSCELGLTGTSAAADRRGPGRICEHGLTGTSATADRRGAIDGNFPQERMSQFRRFWEISPRSASRSVHRSSTCQCRRFWRSWSHRNECRSGGVSPA